jgi:tail tube GTA-gp10-like protein
MSAPGTRTIIWAHGEDQFCIAKVGLLLDLEAKCCAPIGVIFKRLGNGDFSVNDVRETIRLGLIGGGLAPEKAIAAVKNHVDLNEHGVAPSVLVAYAVVEAYMVGVPDDPVGKEMPAEAKATGSPTTTDASDAPK